ncbi:MAG: hypothetical protein HUJ71_08750 [Pseudobutyrivibrio sp.]|nr:hypothetical protein [Pseudobutyrivibrio sp.]
MKDLTGMSFFEIKDYANTLSPMEFDEFCKIVDLSEFDDDLEPEQLLTSSKLYDYLKYKKDGEVTIEL